MTVSKMIPDIAVVLLENMAMHTANIASRCFEAFRGGAAVCCAIYGNMISAG
jgi:hypothetical protein